MTDTNEVAVTTPKTITPKTVAGFTRPQIDLIKRTVAKGASDDELKLFLHICNKTNLDPFMKQIYMMKIWNQDIGAYVMTAYTGIDGYRMLSDRSKNYAPGKDTTYEYDEDKKLVSATAYIQKRVDDKWFEVSSTARYDEYVQLTKDKSTGEYRPKQNWKVKPHIMLAKCAEALAHRKAFPAETSGVYIAEEIGGDTEEIKGAPDHLDDKMTPVQLKYFHTQITNAGINKDLVKLEINKRWNLSTSKDLNNSQAAEILEWAKSMQVGQ